MRPDAIISDPRPGANPRDFSWTGNHDEIGAFWRGFETLWLPASLLEADQQSRIADALFAATRHWGLEIQFEKGLAGAPDNTIAAARDTATNPAVLSAFGLALIGSYGPPAYPGIPGFASDLIKARGEATMVGNAMRELREIVPEPASYVSESKFFLRRIGSTLIGARITSGCRPSSGITTRMGCSLPIMVSAARTGATTVLRGAPRISRQRPSISAILVAISPQKDRYRRTAVGEAVILGGRQCADSGRSPVVGPMSQAGRGARNRPKPA